MPKLPVIKPGSVRTRIAPSPTGWLHLGTARTALFNYLFAKKHGGKFILRIEDTDLERSDKKYEKDIIEQLKWLGIEWDEGPDAGGEYAPYRQSERTAIYSKYAEKLLEENKAFYCFHSEEELEAERKTQLDKKQSPKHVCAHFGLDEEKKRELMAKGNYVIRFRPAKKKVVFEDLIRGEIEFDSELLGDFSIAKEVSVPLYNFAVVVDDYEMKINFVIRGEDHISNTPKQILLQEALGFEMPKYAHLPLILNPDRTKLSKRFNKTSILDYKKEGFLPEALVNFIAMLGWNPGTDEDFFGLADLEKRFSLERVQKSGAVFNLEKLEWLNSHYIRQMDLGELTRLCLPYFGREVDFEYAEKIVALERERMKKLSDIKEAAEMFFAEKFEYDKELLRWKGAADEKTKENLNAAKEILNEISEGEFNAAKIKEELDKKAKETGAGDLYWPLRVSLSGRKFSPPPQEIAAILGKKKTLERIDEALKKV